MLQREIDELNGLRIVGVHMFKSRFKWGRMYYSPFD